MTIAIAATGVAARRRPAGTRPDPANLQAMATTEADTRRAPGCPPRRAPAAARGHRVPRRLEDLPSGDVGVDDVTFSVRRGEFVFLVGSTGSGKSTLMRLLIKELEPTAGTIRVAGRDLAEIDRRKVPYYRRNLGVVFQDFKLLPNRTVHDNVAYALQVTGGTRARRSARRCPTSCGSPACRRSCTTPRPALRRRAAARHRRARVRQPPAAAAGRRADRQPRPRDVDRDHAAALPDQPHGHDRRRRHARLTRWSTACAGASSSSSRGRIVRDEAAGLYAPREQTTAEFGALLRERAGAAPRPARPSRPPSAPRTCSTTRSRRRLQRLMRSASSSARRCARCRATPSRRFAAMARVLVTVLVLGVFIPVVQATTGRGQRRAQPRAGQRLPQDDAPSRPTSSASATARGQGRPRRRVQFVSKRAGLRASSASATPRPTSLLGLQPAAGHVPRHARQAGQRAEAARRALAADAGRRAHGDRPGDRRGQELARTRRRRSSSPRAW